MQTKKGGEEVSVLISDKVEFSLKNNKVTIMLTAIIFNEDIIVMNIYASNKTGAICNKKQKL